ncbi:hypothetical protein Pcinc_044404 [Petrolisthes cinctipes]|uniref:Ig-like domain-containing protein n=1 Tax=Petrolisthes cinctipes TaxID=88211 RepID=A0AAE1BER9_PETCI|nr:hypothetical protein Pcinc_044404 [Petrolisthes cinctipes]
MQGLRARLDYTMIGKDKYGVTIIEERIEKVGEMHRTGPPEGYVKPVCEAGQRVEYVAGRDKSVTVMCSVLAHPPALTFSWAVKTKPGVTEQGQATRLEKGEGGGEEKNDEEEEEEEEEEQEEEEG